MTVALSTIYAVFFNIVALVLNGNHGGNSTPVLLPHLAKWEIPTTLLRV